MKLACIPVDPPIDMEIGLLWRKGTYLRSGASQFMDFMVRQGGARR